MQASHWFCRTLLIALAILASPAAWSQQAEAATFRAVIPSVDLQRRVIKMDEGISLPMSMNWLIAKSDYRNAVELLTQTRRGRSDSRTIVTLERRLDHADAVSRLGAIASRPTGSVRFLGIGSWPALRMRFREPFAELEERRGELGELRNERESGRPELALHSIVAIAVGDSILRVETTVDPDGNERRAREAEGLVLRAMLPARQNARATRAEITGLQSEATRRRSGTGNGDARAIQSPNDSALNVSPELRTRGPTLWGTGSTTAVAVAGTFSETSAGISSSGTNMIVASNVSLQTSNDGGANFTSATSGLPAGFGVSDPSIAIGRSGNMYLSEIDLPGRGTTGGLTGCNVGVVSSGNNGAAFALAGNARTCPVTGSGMCFPDQPFIAADRTNASPGRGDQLYAVWRNFPAPFPSPASCARIRAGVPRASLSCSSDSGSHWSAPLVVSGDDYPRLTVGQDGFVYVVIREGSNVLVHKYTSCGRGLVEVTGFPRTVVSGISDPSCPLPGLDRCSPSLIVPTVAVDDTNALHIYVAFGKSSSGAAGNDDIVVVDSSDGGVTWGTPVAVNGSVTGRRFMPWVCSSAGNAYVGWYDRRAANASGATNDLTDFFIGGATTRNRRLVPDGERNISGTADPQCASGWPGSPMSTADAEGCSVQPQLAGVCTNGTSTGSSFRRCDFSSGPACPSGESCSTGTGFPKYGDYNGIACNADRVLLTWASATAPAGLPPVPTPLEGVTVFADVANVNGSVTIIQRTVPTNDVGRFNVLLDGSAVTSSTAQSSSGPFLLSVTTPHRVGESAASGTSLADYETFVSGDCDADGTIHFSALHPASCRVTNTNRGYQRCVNTCSVAEGICMDSAHTPSERQACIQEREECVADCAKVSLTVIKSLVPSSDTGRFNLEVDGTIGTRNVGDGGSTPEMLLVPGVHTVSESAAAGTSLGDYETTIGGACDAGAHVTLGLGQRKTCVVTNSRKPGTGADASLTVMSILVPATDPGRFDLRIDGQVRAAGVGNAGTTNPVGLLAGPHTVDQVGSGGTRLSDYVRTISGDCDAAGLVILRPGDNKTCTVTNRRDTSACEASCNVAEGICMSQAHSSSDRQECIKEKNECVRDCRAP